jgi:hypothetical protein
MPLGATATFFNLASVMVIVVVLRRAPAFA